MRTPVEQRKHEKRVLHRKAHPEIYKERDRWQNIKRWYGWTREQWTAQFEKQNKRCATCRTDDPKHKLGWATDHNHLTGKVRGILCHRCNLVVGVLEKNSDLVPTLREYIKCDGV